MVAGAIGAGLLPSISSGSKDRTVLDGVRNRQYAADAGIERSIARIRVLANPGVDACGGPDSAGPFNGVTVRVECVNRPTVAGAASGDLVLQHNVGFTACVDTGSACTTATTIITAQVNYKVVGSAMTTFVQAWSVNG